MTDSILKSTKKALNLDADYTEFDPEITMHINSIFSILNQIGIGPEIGFQIEDANDVWSTFLGTSPLLNHVKTYMYLRVRMLFDPPTTAYHVTAMEKQIEEMEVRMNVLRESTAWFSPNPTSILPEDEVLILDGGSA